MSFKVQEMETDKTTRYNKTSTIALWKVLGKKLTAWVEETKFLKSWRLS